MNGEDNTESHISATFRPELPLWRMSPKLIFSFVAASSFIKPFLHPKCNFGKKGTEVEIRGI